MAVKLADRKGTVTMNSDCLRHFQFLAPSHEDKLAPEPPFSLHSASTYSIILPGWDLCRVLEYCSLEFCQEFFTISESCIEKEIAIPGSFLQCVSLVLSMPLPRDPVLLFTDLFVSRYFRYFSHSHDSAFPSWDTGCWLWHMVRQVESCHQPWGQRSRFPAFVNMICGQSATCNPVLGRQR